MDEGYLRQRRNLISISILLLLTVLAGTKINLLFPYAKFDNPGVAELFIWIGFVYLWYRTRIYGPQSIKNVFDNEVIVAYLRINQPQFIIDYNLNSFAGVINFTSQSNGGKTRLTFSGKNDLGIAIQEHVVIPIPMKKTRDVILNRTNKINNWLHGKTITDYHLPHYIAFITLFAGIVNKLDLNIWHAIGFVVIIFLVSKIE